jgi:hypothetical protein
MPSGSGINLYIRYSPKPVLSLSLGRQNFKLISGDGYTRANYTLASWRHSLPWGQTRLFLFSARVKDNIPDDLQLWVQPVGAAGRMRDQPDLLPATDTWVSTAYLDFTQQLGAGLRTLHRIQWDGLQQRQDAATLERLEGRKTSGFFGVLNKAEWSLPLGQGFFEPRWKSEYRRDRLFSTRQPKANSLEETFILLWTQPLLAEGTTVNYFARYGRQLFDTELQLGLEWTNFWMLSGRRNEIDHDFRNWTWVAQLTNRVGYLGYQLVSRVGLQWNQRRFAGGEKQNSSLLFMTVHAGLEGI